MYEIKQKTLDVNNVKIAYTDTGPEDGRVLFCVHGLLSNSRDYDFLAQAAAKKGYRTVAVDLPGRGNSATFSDAELYTPQCYGPFCLALVNHVTGGDPFDWFGVSLGAMIGMGACITPTEGVNIGRFIMVDVGAEISGDALNIVAQLARAPSEFDTMVQAISVFENRCAAWGIGDNQEIWDHLFKHNILPKDSGGFRFHYDPLIAAPMKEDNEDVDLWPVWEQIKQRVLLIRGAKSILLPETVAHEMVQRYTGQKFDEIVFENCGHVPNMMQDDHIEALLNWLEFA